MFMGQYSHSIDDKGRLIIPARLREGLGMRFVVTKGFDRCLYAYPLEEWERIAEQFLHVPSKKEARQLERIFIGSARELELDKQGRALVPQDLREFAGIDRDVVLVGILNKVEIWASDRFDESGDGDMDAMAEDMADLGVTI